jgi:branched-chain amino acid transport system permease protein
MGTIALQLVVNSLIAGLVLAVVAIGFHLAFRTVKVFHLAHGAVFAAGAYLYLLVGTALTGLAGFTVGLVAAVVGAGFVAWALDRLVYRRLAAKGAGQEISLVASMGMYILLVEGLAWMFGNQARTVALPWSGSFDLAGLMLAPAQGLQLLVCVVALGLLLLAFRSERALAFRAVMSQATIASVMGVNANAVKASAMVIGGALAGLAGSLVVMDTGIHPHAGLGITLSAAVAVILGGARSFHGTIIAALALALVQTLTEWFLSAAWKEGITFFILIVVLLWKTEGIIAFNLRPEER